MDRERRAEAKIAEILAELDEETAARVARRVSSSLGRERPEVEEAGAAGEPSDGDDPTPGQDERPSFLQTQVRMSVGRRILQQERGGKPE